MFGFKSLFQMTTSEKEKRAAITVRRIQQHLQYERIFQTRQT